jgi:hypothetical protein
VFSTNSAAGVLRPFPSLHIIIFSTMTKGSLTFLALMAAAATASATGAVELTLENFDDQVKGKNAFVKFLAPW